MSSSAVLPLKRIVSGGQTGVDRAALDVAIECGLEHGGWCPQGRLAEDGFIPARYRLQETISADYPPRTEQNVLDSDGTLILYIKRLYGGTQLTYALAERHGKPCLLVDLSSPLQAGEVRQWLCHQAIRALNVAGPRESTSPGIGQLAAEYLQAVLERNQQ